MMDVFHHVAHVAPTLESNCQHPWLRHRGLGLGGSLARGLESHGEVGAPGGSD